MSFVWKEPDLEALFMQEASGSVVNPSSFRRGKRPVHGNPCRKRALLVLLLKERGERAGWMLVWEKQESLPVFCVGIVEERLEVILNAHFPG